MNKIYTLEDNFNFQEIELEHPNSLQGGSYFTRMNIYSSPVYLQTSSCSIKSGIVNTAKKSYCDLMFNSHDTKTIQWFEELERHCIDAIFQKKDLWFHNEMELDDIETAFTSPIRLYRSGKNYLIRCNVANNSLSTGSFKCYDEHTNPVSLDTLDNSAVKIIPLLEIQGIRFTSKNFTLELALKQVMIIEDPDFMNECFIQPGNIKSIRKKESKVNIEISNNTLGTKNSIKQDTISEVINNPSEYLDSTQNTEELSEEIQSNKMLDTYDAGSVSESIRELSQLSDNKSTQQLDDKSCQQLDENLTQQLDEKSNQQLDENLTQQLDEKSSEQSDEKSSQQPDEKSSQQSDEKSTQQLDEELDNKLEMTQDTLENSTTLLDEVKLNYNNLGNEAIKLKSPEEVYYDLWYEARSRAKLAREEAIKAYLEAKNIKNTYMLDNFSDSEDEFEEYLEE